ncbi:PREDICTED: jmjC domain-containing protein 7-like isoform X1 [Camelina sativa]|uniref:JmjC domain-containing protein 7-like isoform X1 n=1 Tax=Camelina sativa TaxID=90675 RepID=A0ABM0YME0_CAMSA|nr:PREDICTED: jmjC domain-containing protein 7-like isoform X1 [Camelina sativa]
MAEKIENLWREVRELSLGTKIDRLDSPPSPVKFLRDYVSQSKPCVISNAIAHWPALKHWSDPAYLAGALSNDLVSLHLTPNGCADAVTPVGSIGDRDDLCFASAHVEKVLFPEALRAVQSSCKGKKVGYLQQQNDCFRTEYSTVGVDCDGDISWATEAFGCSPEAVNLWIGTEHSVTSFHKDHYENLYAVVSGEKHFLLLPPTDVHRLYIEQYPAANYSYHRDTEAFKLELGEPMRDVPWCSVDPYPSPENEASERLKYPLFFNGPKPFHCTVKAGEILYLPSMWFHHVSQTPGDGGYTIAVNYWYDMQFDIKYAYFNFLQSLSYKSSSLNPILSWREDEDWESSDAERNSD